MGYSFFYGIGSAGNVRGKQIANVLNAKHNPTEGFEDDICIYVKVLPPENHPRKTYLDVDDSTQAVEWLKTHTDTGIIVNSSLGKDYLKKLLSRNDIMIIPHAHCNYENWIRPDRPVKVVGTIGSKTSLMLDIDDLKKRLADIGLEFAYDRDYWAKYGDQENMSEDERRKLICNFYKGIDIQIIWRPDKTFGEATRPLKNPNKLVNAASFGIPTVALREKGFDEWRKNYVEVNSIENLIIACDLLRKNYEIYSDISKRALDHVREYHIDKIKELYLNL